MGLVNKDGVYSTEELSTINEFTNTEYTTDQVTTDKNYVRDSFIDKAAINTDRYPDIVAALLGYQVGSAITVQYFHSTNTQGSTATTSSDLVTRLDGVHQNWLEVVNFEFKLRADLEFTYDPETNQALCTGSGYIYPGFNPSVGDLFLYKTDATQLGQFKVNSVERLTIKHDTCYTISFSLVDFVDQEEVAALKATVDETVYFDRTRYFNNEHVLLYSSEYLLLKDIKKYREELVKLFIRKFYDKYYHTTFIRPDGIYDPYLVGFIKSLIGYQELGTYPSSLIQDPIGQYTNIFSYMLDPYSTNRSKLLPKVVSKIHTNNSSSTVVNSLINKPYLEVVYSDTGDNSIDDISTYYVLSEAYYNTDISNYTQIDQLIVNYIDNKIIDPNVLLPLVKNYRTLTDEILFYRAPIYIFLLMKLSSIVA